MEATFDEVYARYGRGIHAYLVRLTGDPWTAEELCQETFLRYLAHERRFVESNGSLGGWLYRVATNLGIDRLRKRRSAALAGDPAEADDVGGPAPEARDLATRVRAELAHLPAELRATFLLRAHHGLPFRHVAEALGVTERAAKDRFRRTRELLARRLAHLIEESPP